MELAKILADNLGYLKINNIEKAMGLNKTTLTRIIARQEIPEKYKEKIEKWWNDWVLSLVIIERAFNEVRDIKIIKNPPIATFEIPQPIHYNGTEVNKFNTDEVGQWKEPEPIPKIDNSAILSQIEQVKLETKPTWILISQFKKYQEKKIAELKKQLKCAQNK